jgi:sortase A
MKRQRDALGKLRIALFLCGGLALAYYGFLLLRAHLYQKAAERQFEKSVSVPAPITSPQPIADGRPLARFDIPRLKMDTIVVEGDSDDDLRIGAGHIPGTAFPGAAGNVGIAGHRDTFFRPLRNVRAGDVITLTTGGRAYQYEVESTEVVPPERSDVLNPTEDHSLTLVTCFPFYYVGSAPKRFIVHALEIGPDQLASLGQ